MQVLCTSYATARFILSQQQQQKQQQQQQRSCNGSITQQQQQQRVYVVGEQGLLDELRNNGIDAFGGPEGDIKPKTLNPKHKPYPSL